jgi:predicted Zn-dependent protease
MGVAELAGRWLRARRALRREDQIFAERLAELAKRHASEGFYAFDDPLEAAVYSVFIEILKELDGDVDP